MLQGPNHNKFQIVGSYNAFIHRKRNQFNRYTLSVKTQLSTLILTSTLIFLRCVNVKYRMYFHMFYIEGEPPWFNQRQFRYKTLCSVIRSNCQHTKIVYKCSKVTISYLFILLHNVNRLSILRIPGRTLFHVYTSIYLSLFLAIQS